MNFLDEDEGLVVDELAAPGGIYQTEAPSGMAAPILPSMTMSAGASAVPEADLERFAEGREAAATQRNIMGVLGSLMQQSPITKPIFNALRAGVLAGRAGETQPVNDAPSNYDAFLGIAGTPEYGYSQAFGGRGKRAPRQVGTMLQPTALPVAGGGKSELKLLEKALELDEDVFRRR